MLPMPHSSISSVAQGAIVVSLVSHGHGAMVSNLLRELAACGLRLGVDYPQPIVEHAQARTRTLLRFQRPSPSPE